MAASLDTNVAAIAFEVHVEVPGTFLARTLIDLSAIIADEAAKGEAGRTPTLFMPNSERLRIKLRTHEIIFEDCATDRTSTLLVSYARLRDLCIMPVPESYDRAYVEETILKSGKPTLILPATERSHPLKIDTVAVGLGFLSYAARAIADSLPLLERAKMSASLPWTNKKTLDAKHSAEELAKNLSVTVGGRAEPGRRPGACLEPILEGCVLTHGIDVSSWAHTGWPGASSCTWGRDQKHAIQAASPRSCSRIDGWRCTTREQMGHQTLELGRCRTAQN